MLDSLPTTSFPSLLTSHAQRHANQVALIDRGCSLTYAELDSQSRSLAAGLAALGVRSGDRIAVWLPNSRAWLLSFLASAQLGAVVFAVNTRFRAQEVEDILGRGQVDWLILWPDFKGIAFTDILTDVGAACLDRIKGIVCYSEQSAELQQATLCGRPAHAFTGLLATEPAAAVAHDLALTDSGVLVFTTSGTTSLPKFVLHRQRTLVAHGEAVAQALGYDRTTCVLGSTPFCGAFGFATILGALVHGATIVCEPVFDAVQALHAVRKHQVTHTFANNESIANMLDASTSSEDFRSVRFFGFASFSPSLGDLVERAAARGLMLVGLYGSSELNALAAAQPLAAVSPDPLQKYQHQPGGRLVHPGARVRAWDSERGCALPHGESGELQIFSPCAMAGYLDKPDATRNSFTIDGYFCTGDLGFTVDERHFVFLTRLGDSFRLSGFLVNPAEIEAVVDTLAGVSSSQVVESHDGKSAVAFVILAPGASVDEPGWKAQCKQRMAGFKVPARFVALAEFPVVASANAVKIQRGRLREMAKALA
jgi:fatty-acyl-CoA synthase